MPAAPAPLADKAADLVRMKTWALACLLAALVGLVVSVVLGREGAPGTHGAWAWVQAFCEAAVVGALADWFAVVALFRRPLGLPIPHTALIPRSKARIGQSLGDFVRDRFLSPELLVNKLRSLNPAERVGAWLRSPEVLAALVSGARGSALQALALLNEAAVQRALTEFINHQAQRWDAAASGSQVLALLTQDGRHQALLDGALNELTAYLSQGEARELLAAKVGDYLRRKWPALVGALVKVDYLRDKLEGVAEHAGDELAAALVAEVHATLADPAHPLRERYQSWVHEFIERLQHDADFAARVNAAKDRLVHSATVQQYVAGLWHTMRTAIEADLRQDDSALVRHLRAGLLALGQRLGHDPALAEALNRRLLELAPELARRLGPAAAEHIASTIAAWDETELVRQIELGVGRDLQFIRLNGTLVGGLMGLILHAALLPWQ